MEKALRSEGNVVKSTRFLALYRKPEQEKAVLERTSCRKQMNFLPSIAVPQPGRTIYLKFRSYFVTSLSSSLSWTHYYVVLMRPRSMPLAMLTVKIEFSTFTKECGAYQTSKNFRGIVKICSFHSKNAITKTGSTQRRLVTPSAWTE